MTRRATTRFVSAIGGLLLLATGSPALAQADPHAGHQQATAQAQAHQPSQSAGRHSRAAAIHSAR